MPFSNIDFRPSAVLLTITAAALLGCGSAAKKQHTATAPKTGRQIAQGILNGTEVGDIRCVVPGDKKPVLYSAADIAASNRILTVLLDRGQLQANINAGLCLGLQ